MFTTIKKWFKDTTFKCTPIKYLETDEIIIFHWEIPWIFSQTFTVCKKCNKVTVINEIKNDNRGRYNKEKDGEQWSGRCSYAKVPSIGRDKLTVFKD